MKPLRYGRIISSCRTNVMVLLIWLLSLCGALLDPVVAAFSESRFPVKRGTSKDFVWNVEFCEHAFWDDFKFNQYLYFLVIIEFVCLTFLYIRVFCEYRKFVKRRHVFNPDEVHNKKAIVTTLLIVGTFMVCWMPRSLITLLRLFRVAKYTTLNSRLMHTYIE